MEQQAGCTNIWAMKYREYDEYGTPKEQVVHDSFVRVSNWLASFEQDSTHWAKEFLWMLENGGIPAGRIMGNAGTKKHNTSTINCTVSDTIHDDTKSIGHAIADALVTLKAGCGIGFHMSTMRPSNAYVAGVGAKTDGPLSFMDIFDVACKKIMSGGGRRGAMMATFLINHPDIFKFIRAKRKADRFKMFNLSALITKDFMDAVKQDKDFDLFFPAHPVEIGKPDGHKFAWKYWPVDAGYKVENGLTLCRVYDTVKARDIYELMMHSTYDYAEPGFILVDQLNKMNNNWFCETIVASNPCVSPDTKIFTDHGYKRISKVAGRKVNVWNGFEWSTVTPNVTGVNQKMLVIEFNTGMKFRCTKYHGFTLNNGQQVEAQDLKIGMKLLDHDWPVIQGGQKEPHADPYTLGFFSGDGHIKKHRETRHISLYGVKKNLVRHFDYVTVSEGSAPGGFPGLKKGQTRLVLNFGKTGWSKTFVPGASWSVENRLKWFAGLCDSDGCVARSRNSKCIQITSNNQYFMIRVARMLHTLGVASTMSSDARNINVSYRLNVSAANVIKLTKLGLNTLRLDLSDNNPTNIQRRPVRVTSIKYGGMCETVYCFNEPRRHMGVFNGTLTNNCGEQGLPPHGACLLGSINLTKFVIDPFTDNARFDFVKFDRVIRLMCRALDIVADNSGLPLPEQVQEMIRKRRHGLGYMGLGSAMVMLGLVYGSDESAAFTEEVTKILAIVGYEEGVSLAKEKGPAPIMNEDFVVTHAMLEYNPRIAADGIKEGDVVKGKTLFTYSHYMETLRTERPDLVQDLAVHGSRYTHHSSIAPTGTISLAFADNASGGIEPSFSHEYWRNLEMGTGIKEKVRFESHELRMYRQFVGHDIELSKLPKNFVGANDIDPYDHIKIQAAAQKWIDSSISKCVVGQTYVQTDHGFIHMEKLGHAKPNEFGKVNGNFNVLTIRGQKPIVSFYNGGQAECVRLTFDTGFSMTTSLVHKLNTADGYMLCPDLLNKWVYVDQLQCTEYKNANKSLFDRPIDLDFATFLGLQISIGYTKHKKEVGTNSSKYFAAYRDVVPRVIEWTFHGYSVWTISKSFYQTVESYIGTAKDRKFPEPILYAAPEIQYGFIRGLMNPVKWLTVNQEFADAFYVVAQSLGLNPYIKNVRGKLRIGIGATSHKLSMLSDSPVHSNKVIADKTDKYVVCEGGTGQTVSKVVQIEHVGLKQVYDIEVEQTHSYLVGGIDSHNTINVATDYDYTRFKGLYMWAADHGLKGITTFRFNPEVRQAVLNTDEDLEKMEITFTLEDGSTVSVNGNDMIDYRGRTVSANNLYTAITQGTLDD